MRKSILTLVTVCFLLGAAACGSGSSNSASQESSQSSTNTMQSNGQVKEKSGNKMGNDGKQSKSLVVYFSRTGENYWNGGRKDLKAGNTAVLAREIARQTGADIFEIIAQNPYSDDYMDTVARNMKEERDNARPAIANPLPDLSKYDIVYLGSPIWNSQLPMIMRTFAEQEHWNGQQIRPFVTHAMSGLSGVDKDYQDMVPSATVAKGFAVLGSDVAHNPDSANPQASEQTKQAVADWLREL